MISRRALLAGGFAAGTTGAASADVWASPRATLPDDTLLMTIKSDVADIRQALSPRGEAAVALIRAARRTFIKNTAKFPDYIDVGLNVWEELTDWLVSVQQPLDVTRQADGRYSMPLWGTTIVLRPDFPETYVGQGYDR